jgi:uncharacterized protein YlxP (DUF503 family)
MTVGLLVLKIHLPAAQSLKDKRQAIQGFQRRLRHRLNLSSAEVGHQELWQRADLAFVSVASHRDAVQGIFDAVLGEAEKSLPGEILDADREFFES